MLDGNDIKKVLLDKGVMLEGHFLLTSGRHSNIYMQCAKLFQYPEAAALVCSSLVEQIKGLDIDLVAGPALGGIIMAYELARQLGVQNIFAERENGVMTFRRGFFVPKGSKVLVAEDVITTGGSVAELISLIMESQAQVVGVACVVDRSGGSASFGVPLYSAIKIDAQTYAPDACPLCASGIPAVKPGSRTAV